MCAGWCRNAKTSRFLKELWSNDGLDLQMNNCLTCEKRSIKPTAWKTAQTKLHRSGKRQWKTGQYILNLHYRRKKQQTSDNTTQIRAERLKFSISRLSVLYFIPTKPCKSTYTRLLLSNTHTHTAQAPSNYWSSG